MKIEISKEWIRRMATIEGNSIVGAGPIARDPAARSFKDFIAHQANEANLAFGRFVCLMRRKQGLSLEGLAEKADIELSDLVEIEGDTRHRPEPRTVYQLANYFHVNKSNLMQIAGLTTRKDERLASESVRFAARSDPSASLSREESIALDAFIKALDSQE
ncbi:transcriptional regulator with XRE-family HTH domain [Pseudomonas fluvialis]|uniref:Transcriptional regulator with XRE-family HTH domain n=1 Tax=Pseudomonas fluvialis TaxID=1793966 RepID=A0A7X0BPT8_9PSED|nr:helix-turn-helix transcriptional regulator [Pseudomonas fluvialis]MBB6340525.1 transcriptional regulator with XRE-family HTH domain [Pseudomonas fluvialis]